MEAILEVGRALRALASAASSHLGSDCYLYAYLGQILLQDRGVSTHLVAGEAAWRTGPGDSDVIAHIGHEKPMALPPGAEGFAYHAWLECGYRIIDFSTYQLSRKAAELDAMDGGKTQVFWAPEVLVTETRLPSYQELVQGTSTGAFYSRNPVIERKLAESFIPDPEDIAIARFIVSKKPEVVLGPNSKS